MIHKSHTSRKIEFTSNNRVQSCFIFLLYFLVLGIEYRPLNVLSKNLPLNYTPALRILLFDDKNQKYSKQIDHLQLAEEVGKCLDGFNVQTDY